MKTKVLLLLIVFWLSACGAYLSISEIKNEPNRYRNRKVYIRGRVVETISIPFVQKGMFQVNDGTGKVWVMSRKRMPFRGDKVTVKGKVRTGVTFARRTFGVVIVEGDGK